jgi:hypothetical protein
MKKYLFLFRGGYEKAFQLPPEQFQVHMQRWMKWLDDLAKQGKLAGAQPLNRSGKVVTGNEKIVTDGPFMESKEIVGGYMICKADTCDEALEIAKGCPSLAIGGMVEVREIEELQNVSAAYAARH